MNVLVTGGAGYIGSHTCKMLSLSGHNPVVLDNLSTGNAWSVKWGPLIVGEISDYDLVTRTIREHHIQAVLHFAASAYVGESVIQPRKYYRNNVGASLSLLDAVLDSDIRYFVFSSSCATYGIPHSLPICENHQQNPISPYGESKLFLERVLKAYESSNRLKWATLRYFNAAGADPDGEIGEHHDPETHLIPSALSVLTGDRTSFQIFGTDYPTPDGTAIRDFVHVSDLAQAHVLALQHIARTNNSVALNLGSGCGFSVLEILETIEAVAGTRVPQTVNQRRIGDPPILVADPTLSKHILGWSPHLSSLSSIIQSAWEWSQFGGSIRQPAEQLP